MTKKQYRIMLKRLGMTQIEAAKWLGVSLRTSQNYATGGTDIPEPAARLLRLAKKLSQRGILRLDTAMRLMK